VKVLNDLRFVIGLFFTLVGIILIGASLFGPSDIVPGVGVKGNLWAGLPMVLFGLAMLLLALRGPHSEH